MSLSTLLLLPHHTVTAMGAQAQARGCAWGRRRLLALGSRSAVPGAALPAPLLSPPHQAQSHRVHMGTGALTLCRGAAIRQSSQINSWPVQENRQLSTGDNVAFVLRLQVQGQLPVLHCEG